MECSISGVNGYIHRPRTYIADMSLGERIKGLRKGAGLSQIALAKLVGVHQSSICDLERGNTKKGFGLTLVKIARALHTNPDWLATGRGLPNQPASSNIDEAECLSIFRSLSDDMRAAWIAMGRSLAEPHATNAAPAKKSAVTV